MARTEAGALLTTQHREAQTQIRAQALRDYLRLWPLWQGDDESFGSLIAATIPLVIAYHRLSSSIGASYYDSFRRAERISGNPTPRMANPIDADRVAGSLQVTGRSMTHKALLSGRSPEDAMRTAFVRTSGTVTRHVLEGGRNTLVLSTGEDREAEGWSRVTATQPCAFCAMLASRGPVYRGESTAEFQAHDHCACMAEPSYVDSEWPGRAREFGRLYDQAQREARANGDLERGTSNDALNAFRRLLETERA